MCALTNTFDRHILCAYEIVLCRTTTYSQRGEQCDEECLLCNGHVMLYCALKTENWTTTMRPMGQPHTVRRTGSESCDWRAARSIETDTLIISLLATMIYVHNHGNNRTRRTWKESHRHFSFISIHLCTTAIVVSDQEIQIHWFLSNVFGDSNSSLHFCRCLPLSPSLSCPFSFHLRLSLILMFSFVLLMAFYIVFHCVAIRCTRFMRATERWLGGLHLPSFTFNSCLLSTHTRLPFPFGVSSIVPFHSKRNKNDIVILLQNKFSLFIFCQK